MLEARFGVDVPNLSVWRRRATGDLTSTCRSGGQRMRASRGCRGPRSWATPPASGGRCLTPCRGCRTAATPTRSRRTIPSPRRRRYRLARKCRDGHGPLSSNGPADPAGRCLHGRPSQGGFEGGWRMTDTTTDDSPRVTVTVTDGIADVRLEPARPSATRLTWRCSPPS